MNLAILISVSKYADSYNDLPACTNDVALIDSILTQSAKFTEVLRLESDTSSSRVKSELARFVKAHKGQTVEELFFYYTGHGDAYLDDFYFLLSDFDEDKRQQTSLANSELDSMLRSLSPSLTIKLVDACHSSVTYVKNANMLEKSLASSKGNFDRCYFMFSSQKEQPSYQDAHLSDFTESFARSIMQRSDDSIRYKDIADFVSDDFQLKGHQKPAFVLQADLTDVFCSVTPEMREDLKKRLTPASTSHSATNAAAATTASGTTTTTTTTTTTNAPELEKTLSLRDLVVREAEQFCTEVEGMNALADMRKGIEGYAMTGELAELYKLELSFKTDFGDIPKIDSVASWLSKNANDYFVEVKYRAEQYEDTIQVPKIYGGIYGSHYRTMADLTGGHYDTRTVTKTREVPDTISLTAKTPYCAFEIRLNPIYENLPWWTEFAVLVFSKSQLRMFYAIVRLKETNWTEREAPGEIKWKTKEVSLKDGKELLTSAHKMNDELVDTASKALREKYGLRDDVSETNSKVSSKSGSGGQSRV